MDVADAVDPVVELIVPDADVAFELAAVLVEEEVDPDLGASLPWE